MWSLIKLIGLGLIIAIGLAVVVGLGFVITALTAMGGSIIMAVIILFVLCASVKEWWDELGKPKRKV